MNFQPDKRDPLKAKVKEDAEYRKSQNPQVAGTEKPKNTLLDRSQFGHKNKKGANQKWLTP